MGTSAHADRLLTRERSFIAAVRVGDHDSLERLLAPDFTAAAMGEGRVDRQEFLRRAIYSDIYMPTAEPTWSIDEQFDEEDALAEDTIGYEWVDGNGTNHGRLSTWNEDEDGVLRIRRHVSGTSRLNGTTDR